jgi:hypothetical protein
VTELSGRDLSYWALGIESCVDKIISASPASGFSSGTNVAPSFNGIKWTVDNQFSDSTFSFTLNGAYQSRPRPVLMMSNQSATQSIAGPDCTLPGASPTPTPAGTPAPTATPGGGEGGEGGEGGGGELDCDCSEGAGYEYGVQYILHEPVAFAPGNVGWIRWEGDTPSTTDLEYNINYPAESDIVAIGDWIEGTTGIKNSVLPAIALEQWIGKEIIIPVFDQVTGTGSNAEYRICAFAVFILDDYDRSEKEMTGRFVRTIIRGEESAPDGPDFGARDVRLVK